MSWVVAWKALQTKIYPDGALLAPTESQTLYDQFYYFIYKMNFSVKLLEFFRLNLVEYFPFQYNLLNDQRLKYKVWPFDLSHTLSHLKGNCENYFSFSSVKKRIISLANHLFMYSFIIFFLPSVLRQYFRLRLIYIRKKKGKETERKRARKSQKEGKENISIYFFFRLPPNSREESRHVG